MIDGIKNSIKEVIEENGYILEDVLYLEEDGLNFLRVIINKEDSIEVDDCVIVSKLISPIIDKLDPIKESYILDVCSAGKEDIDE